MRRAATTVIVTLILFGAAGEWARADALIDARARSEAGDWDGAETLYRQALKGSDAQEVKSELAAVLYNRALILGRKGAYAETVPLLSEALELAPELMDARVALVLSYDELGKKGEAAKLLARSGAIYMATGQPQRAAEALREATQRDPRPEYRLELGDALLMMEDYHGALEQYRAVEGKLEHGPGLHRRMGDAYMRLGLVEPALAAYERAAELDESASTSLFLTKLYVGRGDWERVIEKVEEAERRGAAIDANLAFVLANAHYLLGQESRAAGDREPALREFEAAVRAADRGLLLEGTPELFQIKGLALLLMGNMEECAEALESAIARMKGPVPPQVYQALVVAYEQLGESEKAEQARSHLK